MNEIARLLAAGYDVEFYSPDNKGRIECLLTSPAGDVICTYGNTPAAALAEASPLEPESAPSVEDRLSALEENVEQIWMHMIMNKLGETGKLLDGIRGQLFESPSGPVVVELSPEAAESLRDIARM